MLVYKQYANTDLLTFADLLETSVSLNITAA